MQKIILKSQLGRLLETWMKTNIVVAPVKEKKVSHFRKITSSQEYWPEFLTEVTAKSHFMPDGESLLEYKSGKPLEMKGSIKKTVLFGMRKCDLNAIQIMDKVMYDAPYKNKRANTVLVGMFCEKSDEYCFCNSMELQDFYDLYFYPKGEYYIIDVKTKKGEALVEGLKDVEKEIKIPNPKNEKSLKTLEIDKYYKNKKWSDDVKKCLSCGACTAYCPTCNCFDIKHEIQIDETGAKRKRYHSSCMTKDFSKVAGDHVFRDSRLSRFKHFVYHKISYFKKQRGRPMCVGCGRCLRVCPTNIDWVKTINKMRVSK